MPRTLLVFYFAPFAVLLTIGFLVQDLVPRRSPIWSEYDQSALGRLSVIGQSIGGSLFVSLIFGSLFALYNHAVIYAAEKLGSKRFGILGLLIFVANVALAIWWMNFLPHFGHIEYRDGKPIPVTAIVPFGIAIVGAGTILAAKSQTSIPKLDG